MRPCRSTCRRGVAAALAVAFAAAAAPAPAAAAACCVSATSFGVGRLLVWEDWAVGLQLGHARSLGQYEADGGFRPNGSELSEGITHAQVFAIVRLHERVQLQGWLPALVNDRSAAGDSQVAGGPGDAGAAVRLELVPVGAYRGLPSLAVTAGAVAPTGRRVEETEPPLFAGATGRGAWGASLALEAELAPAPWFARLEAGATRFFPFERDDTGASQQLGTLVTAGLSAGREVVPDALVLALGVTGEWEGPVAIDGAELPRSRAHLWSATASASWRLEPHWTLTLSAASSLWPDGGGANRDARAGFTIGIRHGHF